MPASVNKDLDAALTTSFAPSSRFVPYLDDRVYHSTKPDHQTYSNIRGTSDQTGRTNSFRSFEYALHSSKDTTRPAL
jgi:hypothetical protein